MRIAHPGAVYRSVDAGHLTIAKENQARRAEAVRAMESYALELVPQTEPDHPDGPSPYGTTYDDGGFRFAGITAPSNVTVPDGMRIDTKVRARFGTVLVPRTKTEAGRVIAARMAELSFTPRPLGAVSDIVVVTDGDRRWFQSAVIEIVGDQVFAEYHHPIDDERFGPDRPSDRQKVESDPGWEPCPLSEFYAAREAAEPAPIGGTR